MKTLKDQLLAWIAYLRANPEKQIIGVRHLDNLCCALGAYEIANGLVFANGLEFNRNAELRLLNKLGLNLFNIIAWNDKRKFTFPEIADRLEGHGKLVGLID